MKLHLVALRYGPCLIKSVLTSLNKIAQSYLAATHTFYTSKGRATPGNLHSQSSTAITHCLLIATHFTDPSRKNDSLCQVRECHGQLKRQSWRQMRLCQPMRAAVGQLATPIACHWMAENYLGHALLHCNCVR